MVFGFGSSTAAAKPAVVPNVKSISTQDLDEEGWVNVFSQADNVSAAAVNSCTGAASVAKETAEENFEDYEKGASRRRPSHIHALAPQTKPSCPWPHHFSPPRLLVNNAFSNDVGVEDSIRPLSPPLPY